MPKMFPVIMCGGSGTRLWPVSVKSRPKQYQAMTGQTSMLTDTINRIADNAGALAEAPVLVTSAAHRAILESMESEFSTRPGKVLLEPMGRNTAAVTAVSAAMAAEEDPEALVILLPSDHVVLDGAAFWSAIEEAAKAAREGYIVTLGIAAETPETGYGYVRRGAALPAAGFKVDAFVEKPDLATAKDYVADGNYFWNAGIFVFKAAAMLEEFRAHAPEILEKAVAAYETGTSDGIWHLLDADYFGACPEDSIDYAIMEKTDRAAVVGPVSVGWNDIGSWAAVRDVIAGGETQSITKGNVTEISTQNCLIRSDGPFLAAIGVEDLIIVATGKSVLVCKADHAQDVKKVINMLKDEDRTDLL